MKEIDLIMSDYILLNSKEKVLALKDGDRVRLDANGREFTVCNFNDSKIYFHGGWNQNEQVIHIRRRATGHGTIGIAVWTREEFWEYFQYGDYYVG